MIFLRYIIIPRYVYFNGVFILSHTDISQSNFLFRLKQFIITIGRDIFKNM